MTPRLSMAVTALLGALLLVAVVVQGQTILASFRNGDAVVANFRQMTERQTLIAACNRALEEATAARGDGAGAALRLADGLGPGQQQVAAALRSGGVPALEQWCTQIKAESANALADNLRMTSRRSDHHRNVYVLLLLTGNLTLLLIVAAGVVAVLYANEHAESRQRINRARRTVLEAEQKRAGFLAAAGHDLRQPMQALRLFVDAILRQDLDPPTRDKAGKISAAATAMERMVNSLIDVAKLDAGLIDADKHAIPLRQLMGSFRAEFEQLAANARLDFSMRIADVAVQTDPDMLERIFRNLIGNAIKYTRTGGVEVIAAECGGTVTVEVRDTGIGIPADQLSGIFEDFTRVSGGQSDGLGLGLGIVRRLADLLNVSVTVESVPGAGSTFRVSIPAAHCPAPPPSNPPTADRDALRVLVVDDHPAAGQAVAAVVSSWGHRTSTADSVQRAMHMLHDAAAEPPDILIVDYDLGDGTGLDLLKSIAEGRPVLPLALIITGSSAPDVLRRVEASGYPWLRKPVDGAALRARFDGLAEEAARRRLVGAHHGLDLDHRFHAGVHVQRPV